MHVLISKDDDDDTEFRLLIFIIRWGFYIIFTWETRVEKVFTVHSKYRRGCVENVMYIDHRP